jgi:hypothetical protein
MAPPGVGAERVNRADAAAVGGTNYAEVRSCTVVSASKIYPSLTILRAMGAKFGRD